MPELSAVIDSVAVDSLYPGGTPRTLSSHLFTSSINVKDFGAVGDGVTDDHAAIQAAINEALRLQGIATEGNFRVLIPPGVYVVSAPLRVFVHIPGDGSFRYVTVAIEGEAMGYAGGVKTELLFQNPNLPGIIIQKGRNIKLARFSIRGVANSLALPSYANLLADSVSPWWNTGGARDNFNSPHAGIVLDPFEATFPTGTDRYPGLESYYTSPSGGGTTGLIIDDEALRLHLVDDEACLSPPP